MKKKKLSNLIRLYVLEASSQTQSAMADGQRSLDGMRAKIILSSFGLRRGVIKNELIAKINLEGRALLRKLKKSSQEDNIVIKYLKCKLYQTYKLNAVQKYLNLNQILI